MKVVAYTSGLYGEEKRFCTLQQKVRWLEVTQDDGRRLYVDLCGPILIIRPLAGGQLVVVPGGDSDVGNSIGMQSVPWDLLEQTLQKGKEELLKEQEKPHGKKKQGVGSKRRSKATSKNC